MAIRRPLNNNNSSSQHIPILQLILVFLGVGFFCYNIFERSKPSFRREHLKTPKASSDSNSNLDIDDRLFKPLHSYTASSSKSKNAEELNQLNKLRSQLLNPSIVNVDVDTIYVLPGGGSGNDHGYPEWTKRRVLAAHKDSLQRDKERNLNNNNENDRRNSIPPSSSSIFLTLSAGSLNSPNTLFEDNRIIFECQHMIKHLIELGVAKERVYGDMFSWDTVTNALVVRMFVEGLLAIKNTENYIGDKPLISIQVFISDFHAERTKAALQWVLGLEPSVLNRSVELVINIVGSEGIDWGKKENFQDRIKHEEKGTQTIIENAKTIKSIGELYAFLLLGPHRGIFSYLHSSYKTSSGGGW